MTPEQRLTILEKKIGIIPTTKRPLKENTPERMNKLKKIQDWYDSQGEKGFYPSEEDIQKKFSISDNSLDDVLDYLGFFDDDREVKLKGPRKYESRTKSKRSSRNLKESHCNTTPEEFMEFFRSNECLDELSNDDRIEIFMQILPGSSDITKELIQDLFDEYNISNLEVIEV